MSLFPSEIEALAAEVLERAKSRGWQVTTAESCTGGLVAAALTEIAGSSAMVERGLVTYANSAKAELLGVPRDVLAAHGAVSEQVVRAMAEGARAAARAELAVAITGVAGPGGGSPDKPVGLVWFATAVDGEDTIAVELRFGDLGRSQVRLAAVRQALTMLSERLA